MMTLRPEQWVLLGAAILLGVLIGIVVTLGWRWYVRRRERLRRKRRIDGR
jgi:predicted negative regulator of RcsB-dependent stress response